MNGNNLIEFQTLSIVMNNPNVWTAVNRQNSNALENMIKRYKELIDMIIEQYKLPNLPKDPVKD